MRAVFLVLGLMLAFPAPSAWGESYAEIQDRRPDLFDPETGYRIARQRAPTPDNIPGPAQIASPVQTRELLEGGALVLDVFAASQSRYDELDGMWLVAEPRMSLPGAVWLPETGRGRLEPMIEVYLRDNLVRLTEESPDRPILVYCVADCWMSWNAAQRIAAMGYPAVYWYRLGTDGWLDIGETLEPVMPVPVNVD